MQKKFGKERCSGPWNTAIEIGLCEGAKLLSRKTDIVSQIESQMLNLQLTVVKRLKSRQWIQEGGVLRNPTIQGPCTDPQSIGR